MTEKASISEPIVAALLGMAAAPSAILLFSNSTKDNRLFIFGIISFALCAVSIMWLRASLKELRDHIPSDALDRLGHPIPADALDRLGKPIPEDAIDRRWVLEIRDALNERDYIWPTSDPLEAENQRQRQQTKDIKVSGLIDAALAARGVRLPLRPPRTTE